MTRIRVLEISAGPAVAYTGALLQASGLGDVTKLYVPERRVGFGAAAVDVVVEWLDRDKKNASQAELRDTSDSFDWLITDVPAMVDTVASLVASKALLRSLRWSTGAVSDLFLAAETGAMFGNGLPGQEPLFGVGNRIQYAAGLFLFCGLLIAADDPGRPARDIEVVLEAASISLADQSFPAVSYSGRGPRRSGGATGPRQPHGFYPCQDGYVNIFVNSEREWNRFAAMVGDPRLLDPEYFGTEASRVTNKELLTTIVVAWLKDRTKEQVLDIAKQHRLACMPVYSIEEGYRVLRSSGLNDSWQAASLPERARTGPPSTTSGPVEGTGTAAARVPANELESQAPGRPQPLKGLRVVEMTTGWSGPLVGRVLASAGAEVIKIESEHHWDAWRGPKRATVGFNRYPDGTPPAEPRNGNALFNTENRGKRSALLNIQTAEGQDLFRKLVATSDVVLENLRPGSLGKVGLGHADLLAVNPDLTTISIRAAGRSDEIVGWAGVIESLSGVGSLLGYRDDPTPMGSGTSVVDPLTGLWAAALFLAARRNPGGGAGQYIATSMLESVIACVPEPGVSERWAVKNQNTLPDALFQGCFRIAGDDRWLVLSAEDVTAAVALATQVGLTPDGDAAQWLRRPETRRTLSVAVQNAIGDLSAEQVEARFGGPGLLAQRVRSFEEVFADPAIQAAGLFAEIDHAVAGRRHYPISPLDALGDSRRPAPLLGEHSEQVWCGLVGLDADTFHRLRQEGVIA